MITNNGKNRHREHERKQSTNGYNSNVKQIKESPHTSKIRKYSTSATNAFNNAKDVLKHKTTKFLPILNVKNMMNKYKGLSTKTKYTIAIGGAVVLASFAKQIVSRSWGMIESTWTRPLNLFENETAYIPDKYNRGYNEIKEHITDFGSRVHLDKATNKSINKPYNSTRNGRITSTGSIINSNIALNAHKNAIQHNRF